MVLVVSNGSYFIDFGVTNNVLTESRVHDTCREESKGRWKWANSRVKQHILKCHLIHHFDPYIKAGPFHLEIHLHWPFRAVFRDILVEKEMQWMIDISVPQLSAARPLKKSYQFQKSVVAKLKDIEYSEEQVFDKISGDNETLKWNIMPLDNPYEFKISDKILFQISKRVELASNLNVTKRYASSKYQTTNYGLAGIVERHFDPIGYEKGAMLREGQHTLIQSGDIMATFMAWLKDTELGGATAFTARNFESVIHPKKGSAAFWINLTSCHLRDHRSMHAGCPVLKGSKWIVNKWIYSYDQWKQIPCNLKSRTIISNFRGYYK